MAVGNEADPDQTGSLMLGAFLPYQLSVAAEGVSRAFALHYERRFGITIPEWRVMAVLGEGSARTTRDVIARTKMDRVKVSRAAIRLVDKGLIARDTVPDDQRAHALRLSASGDAMYREIVPLARRLQLDLLDVLGAEERAVLTAVLAKIEARADELALGTEPPAPRPPTPGRPAPDGARAPGAAASPARHSDPSRGGAAGRRPSA